MEWNIPFSFSFFSKGQLFEEKKENRPPISDFFCGENSPFCFFKFILKRSQVTWSRELFRKFQKKSSQFISRKKVMKNHQEFWRIWADF
jgi:hypothetical protein